MKNTPVQVRTSRQLTLALMASLLSLANADTLKLKDGTVLDGTATKVTPEEVTFKWRPKPSISDEKVFKRSEIAELTVLTPDEAAAVPLRKLVPTPDNMSATEYGKIIKDQLQPYLSKFPSSKFAKEVQAILDTYNKEMEDINKGGIKLNGTWISPSDFRTKEYIYNSMIILREMEAEMKAGNYKEALDKMTKLKTDYVATNSFVEAIDLYEKALIEMQDTLISLEQAHPSLLEELEKQKQTLNKAELDQLMIELKKNEGELKIKNDIERNKRSPILSYDKYNLNSIKAAKAAIEKELAAVSKLKDQKPKYAEAAQIVEKAINESAKGNPTLALTNFELAKKTLPAMDSRLPVLMAAAKASVDELQKTAPKPTRPPNGGPIPKGDPAKSGDKSGDKSGTKKPDTAKTDGASSKTPEALPEDEDNTMTYLLAGAGVLVLAGFGWTMMGKRRNKDE